MAWFNPFSWGGGPDQVDYSKLNDIIGQIQGQGLDVANRIKGINFGVTAEDQAQYGKSYGFMRDQVLRDLQTKLPALLGTASGQAGARGLAGSGIEAGMRSNVSRGAQRDVADVLSQFGSQQAGVMSSMALNRGQAQVGQNQALWDTILGAYTPGYNQQLRYTEQERQRIAQEGQAFGGFLGDLIGIGTSFIPGAKKPGG